MVIKAAQYRIQGMNRDLSESTYNADKGESPFKWAYEIMNMRVVPISEDNTEFSLVNEKGTKLIEFGSPSDAHLNYIDGNVLGTCTIGTSLILFLKYESERTLVTCPDRIGRITYNETTDKYYYTTLYQGHLNFDMKYPIETIAYYENEEIQKVYWIDGLNQPRVINICNVQYSTDNDNASSWANAQFDFIPYISLNESVSISKIRGGSGLFPSGTVQYVLTYSNEYMQETNIFYQSPLYYTSKQNSAGDGEETMNNSFRLEIQNIDSNYEYLNIYSIIRTSLNSNPIVKKVESLRINGNSATFIDDGNKGSSIDPTELLYMGGVEIIPKAMEQKDNTLFFGNINTPIKKIKDIIGSGTLASSIGFSSKSYVKSEVGSFYPNNKFLDHNSYEITTFKYLEWYRLGLQFQHKSGRWSEVIWIGDYKNETPIEDSPFAGTINLSKATCVVNHTKMSRLINEGFVKVRPVVVYPDINSRDCICQGIICPTVFNTNDRCKGRISAQSSWYTRPSGSVVSSFPGVSEVSSHLKAIPITWSAKAEIEGNYGKKDENIYSSDYNERYDNFFPFIPSGGSSSVPTWTKSDLSTNAEIWLADNNNKDNANRFVVDKSICTLHSPDIEFNPEMSYLDFSNFKLRIIGVLPLTTCSSDIDVLGNTTPFLWIESAGTVMDIQTGIITGHQEATNFTAGKPLGFKKKTFNVQNNNKNGGNILLGSTCWFDEASYSIYSGVGARNANGTITSFNLYPWHSDVLNNGGINENMTSVLQRKIMSNIRISGGTYYFKPGSIWNAYRGEGFYEQGLSDIKIWNNDQPTLITLKSPNGNIVDDVAYTGVADEIITCNTKTLVSFDLLDQGGYNMIGQVVSGNVSHYTNETAIGYGKMIYNRAINCPSITSYNPKNIGDYAFESTSEGYTTLFSRKDIISNNPIRIRYKSSPHVVFNFNYFSLYDSNAERYKYWLTTLPEPTEMSDNANWYIPNWDNSNYRFPWTLADGYYQPTLDISSRTKVSSTGISQYRCLWLGEFYRDDITSATRFGGNTDEALENNTWTPCGPAVALDASNDVTVQFLEGDTYYQRYDHLKTYAYNEEDSNSIVEIISFMCESRINVEGRYDKHKGLSSNLYAHPKNFNLVNSVYSQKNNFFNYRTINPNKLTLSNFSNQITWTKSKVAGEIVDTWCNVTLASFLDMDGNKGEVRSLNRFRNELLCFQDKGLARIKFNENAALQTQSGLPVELANSGRVEGKDYISESVGTKNKWSVVSTPAGLFFIDGYNKSLFRYEPTQASIPVDIANAMGFITYFRNDNVNEIWNPEDNNGYKLQYDHINGDVFIMDKYKCLSFNTRLNCFSSFYSYDNIPYFANFNDEGIFITNELEKCKVWEEHKGLYNIIFDEAVEHHVDIITNPTSTTDKIFNNVEFRADVFNGNNEYVENSTFNIIRSYNEHQDTDEVALNIAGTVNTYGADVNIPSNLKKKFRMWRTNIPRDTITGRRNRIRNPWTHIVLKSSENNLPEGYKHQVNDFIVYYFE